MCWLTLHTFRWLVWQMWGTECGLKAKFKPYLAEGYQGGEGKLTSWHTHFLHAAWSLSVSFTEKVSTFGIKWGAQAFKPLATSRDMTQKVTQCLLPIDSGIFSLSQRHSLSFEKPSGWKARAPANQKPESKTTRKELWSILLFPMSKTEREVIVSQ